MFASVPCVIVPAVVRNLMLIVSVSTIVVCHTSPSTTWEIMSPCDHAGNAHKAKNNAVAPNFLIDIAFWLIVSGLKYTFLPELSCFGGNERGSPPTFPPLEQSYRYNARLP